MADSEHAFRQETISWILLRLRNRHFFAVDVLALLFIPAMALSLRLEGLQWWPRSGPALIFFTIAALLVKLPIFYQQGLYRRYWRYASVNDLCLVLIAVFYSSAILTVVFVSAHSALLEYRLAIYRSVPIIDFLMTVAFVGGVRFGVRGIYHWHRHDNGHGTIRGRRVLVVGAGEAGNLVVGEMWANPQLNLEPVAFADDDPAKVGMHIQGLPVLGTCAQIPELVNRHHVQRIVVAIPSAPLARRRQLTALCEQTGIATHSLPGIYELLAGFKTVSRLPHVDIQRLLHREPIEIDETELAAYLAASTVLVTGAGGSIGGELCRQISRFNPKCIILLGHGENSIFEIRLNLRLSCPDVVTHPVIVDVRDQRGVDRVVKEHRPDVIFHAAAHKHVPLMEANVEEAITNNVLGTQNVLRAAERYGVERFVLISTDKAVNPTSIMGSTKRLAEMLVLATAHRTGRAYIAVRFGNVLGSRGSVIPVFQQQIAAGGPLTVTHPDMCRYFMTIPEAVQLVLQAAQLGRGGEVFALDMGEQVRILDLANDLIELSGLRPGRDIKIIYSGARPGEKICEELFLEGEDYGRTKHPRIFVATPESRLEVEMLEQVAIELVRLARSMPPQRTADQMRHLLPDICRYIDRYRPIAPPAVQGSEIRPAPAKPRLIEQPRVLKPASA